MKALLASLASVTLVAVATFWVAWSALDDYLSSPREPRAEDTIFSMEDGVQRDVLAQRLAAEGLISRPSWFAFYASRLRPERAIAPGEYRLSASMTPVQQLDRLESGELVHYTLVIEPGSTAETVVARIAELSLGDPGVLSGLVRDESFARDLGLRDRSLEGYLFPDVYELPRGLPPRAVLSRLVERFRRVVNGELAEQAKAHGLDESRWVRLAALIETSGLPKVEWPVYSAMLHARLGARLPLDHDEERAEARKKLAAGRAWDTTIRTGLPPFAFASPGRDALAAAARPASLKVLFMIEHPDGRYEYCPDPECFRARSAGSAPSP